jgi:predicted transposase YbfD/YdcC
MYRVLAKVPIGMLEAVLHYWAEENMVGLPPANEEVEGVALDGKALRGSQRQGASDAHLLSAFSHRLGLTLKQLGVDDKTNEIGAMPELLVDLVVEGRIFTMDALHTQRETAQTIVDGGGDYVMIAKGNQPTLQNEIEALFARPDAESLIDDCDTTVDRGHGRIEVRVLYTSSALHDTLDWPGQQQVFCVERQATIVKTDEVRTETVYGVTSLATSETNAARLQELVRGQWGIENRSHYVRDVTFGEDQSQVRKGCLPQVMAALRNVVIGLLRLMGFRFIPEAFDRFAARSFEALAAIGC